MPLTQLMHRVTHILRTMSTAAATSSSAPAAAAAPHANVAPVAALLGRWVGQGKGVYPTINDFAYEEELSFTNTGKPFVSYTQRTWKAGTNRAVPMHEENGFLRFVGGPGSGAKVEAMVTQCTGVQEVLAGSWEHAAPGESDTSFTISLASTGLERTPSAKHPFVTTVARRYTVDTANNTLTAVVDMATENTPELQNHLTATLTKQN